jgi:SPP1 family predicted phage head-tail adaptor
MTTIGDLRDVVTIQASGTDQDDIGDTVPSWGSFVTLRANVRDLSGRELIAAQAVQNQVTTLITIRWRDDIVPSMRVVRGADVFVIQDVLNPSGKRDWLQLMCVRGVANAESV